MFICACMCDLLTCSLYLYSSFFTQFLPEKTVKKLNYLNVRLIYLVYMQPFGHYLLDFKSHLHTGPGNLPLDSNKVE